MFGTSGVRGPVGETVTPELAVAIAKAVAMDTDRVVIGRDARESGRALRHALTAGFIGCGVDVVDVGRTATPTLARAVAHRDADAGVMVTASHNPAPDNGIKLWNPSGQAFDTAQQERIERRIENGELPQMDWSKQGTYANWDDATALHCEALVRAGRARRDEGLDGVHIVVDMGNGMGTVTADALYELGATVETLNAQPDGRFPARASEPTAEHCEGLRDHVVARDADLGIAHDGDADRMLAVSETGEFVSGDTLLAIFARAHVTGGDAVAAPVNTSLAVDDTLAEVDASVVRTRVGDVYIAERTGEESVVFGGEPSGAWIFPTETQCPDGPLAAVVLATLVADRSLSDRVSDVPAYPIRRGSIETESKEMVMERVTETVEDMYDDVRTIDGVHVQREDGWFLIRASGTQPLVRITAEARTAAAADELFEEIHSLVRGETTE